MTKEAKPDTWMPLVIGDYLKDTGRLTTEQHGAYLLLIMDYWVEGPPRDDDEDLAAITRLDARSWKKTRAKLQAFFYIEDGRWRHKRVDAELADWTERKRKNTERASAGGKAKAAKAGASSSASSTFQAEKTGPKTLLKPCSASISTEVDAPTGQSTLCDEGSISDLKKASLDDERSWAFAISEAERDELRCRRSDPDLNSELCEFIATAKSQVADLRRARLSIVVAA